MVESLLTQSSIKLFGRIVVDFKYTYVADKDSKTGGSNNFLKNQLSQKNVNVARIYAFAFEGSIYTLPRPTMFLVHGPGADVDSTQAAKGNHTSLDESGVVAREWEFAATDNKGDGPDLRMWEYEKGDFSVRLDSEAGPFEDILLGAALRSGADRSGQGLEIRSGQGLDVRSGQGLDVRSGQGLRTGR